MLSHYPWIGEDIRLIKSCMLSPFFVYSFVTLAPVRVPAGVAFPGDIITAGRFRSTEGRGWIPKTLWILLNVMRRNACWALAVISSRCWWVRAPAASDLSLSHGSRRPQPSGSRTPKEQELLVSDFNISAAIQEQHSVVLISSIPFYN